MTADNNDTEEHKQRAVAIFMGSAAHDLRTPLNTMAGWLQVLQSAPDLPEATRERAFKGLQSAVAQQTALADGLAQMSAIRMRDARGEAAPVDVDRALADAIAGLEGEARAKGVGLSLESEGETVLHSDAPMVAALLRHSLAGALKFAAKNSAVYAAIKAAPEGETGCTVTMSIEQSLLPSAGIAAILRYARGIEATKPNGVGAAFFFGVGQGIAAYLGGSFEMAESENDADVTLVIKIPSRN